MIDWLAVLGIPAVLGAGVALHASVTAYLERRRRELERRLGGRANLLRVQAGATFIGRQGGDPLQGQGMGTLTLTREVLHFELLWGRRELQVPLDAVQSVDTPLTFRNTFVFKPLLVVRVRAAGGTEDALGFSVDDAAAWKAALERAHAGRRRRTE